MTEQQRCRVCYLLQWLVCPERLLVPRRWKLWRLRDLLRCLVCPESLQVQRSHPNLPHPHTLRESLR